MGSVTYGVHVVLDYSSLYPTVIRSMKISPESMIIEGDYSSVDYNNIGITWGPKSFRCIVEAGGLKIKFKDEPEILSQTKS